MHPTEFLFFFGWEGAKLVDGIFRYDWVLEMALSPMHGRMINQRTQNNKGFQRKRFKERKEEDDNDDKDTILTELSVVILA